MGTSSDCNYCISPSCTPTITPAENFDVNNDRVQLQKGMKSWSKDTVINILSARSDFQRLQIAKEYVITGKTLMDDLTGKDALIALTKPLTLFYAEEINKALKLKNRVNVAEILTTLPGCAITDISVMYQIMYDVSLFKDISSFSSGSLRYLLLGLAKGDREEKQEVNNDQVKKDVDSLIKGGVNSWFTTSHSKFVEVFTKRSFTQLKSTFEAYDKSRREKDPKYTSIFKDIAYLFTDRQLNQTYSNIVRYTNDHYTFFAEELETSLATLSKTKDSSKVIRIIRGRSELDLTEIKQSYTEHYQKPLSSRIKEKTNKELGKTLVAILKD